VEAWELGFKAEFWERRARLGLAAFQMNYSDRQFLFSSPENPSITETVNTPETVKVRGLEADLQLIAAEGLSLTFNYAWTDPDLPILTNPFPPNPQVFPDGGGQTPKHAASAALAYDFQPLAFGNLRLHLDSTYNSGFFTSNVKTDSFVLVNARLTLSDLPITFGAGDLEVSLWASNLFDKEYTFFKFPLDAPGFVGSNIDFYGPPRMFGAELMMRF
jgi:iron complex outermembrane receptor protein